MASEETNKITVEEFREFFPEFVNPPYTDAVIQRSINLAYCYASNFDRDNLCDCWKDVLFYLTAHLLTLWDRATTGSGTASGASSSFGIAQSSKIGDVSVSMALPTMQSISQAWLNSTYWGQILYALLMAHASTPRYIGGHRNRLFWTH